MPDKPVAAEPQKPRGNGSQFRRRTLFVAVTVAAACWLFFGCGGEASARPMSTAFVDVMKNSPTIAVAKLLAAPDPDSHTATLDFGQVLKGAIAPGKHKIAFTDFPHLGTDAAEAVVFLDKELVWRFVAVPLDNQQPVDKAVLGVHGFNDWNAHWVYPGLVTLEQLKSYIKDGSLVYRFRGNIYFPQLGKADWKPSSLSITGNFDAVKNQVAVKGLPVLKGIPAQPDIDVHSRDERGKIDLIYQRNLGRQLELMGNVVGRDGKTGEIQVQFAATSPEILTEAAFKDYLNDAGKGGFFATFKLPCVPEKGTDEKRVLSLTLGKWLDGGWDSTQLEGWDKNPIKILAMQYDGPDEHSGAQNYVGASPFPKATDQELDRKDAVLRLAAKTASGDFIILTFNLGGPLLAKGPFNWTFQNELRNVLYTRQIHGSVQVYDGKTITTVAAFTPAFDSLGFNRNGMK